MELTLFSFAWISLIFGVAYLLSAHFLSTLPIHILHFLHRCGWDKAEERKMWWDQFPEFEIITIDTPEEKNRVIEWQDWFIMAFNETWLQRMAADLITCPICLSFHLSFWGSTFAITLLFFALSLSPWIFALIPFYTISIAFISLTLFKYVRKHL